MKLSVQDIDHISRVVDTEVPRSIRESNPGMYDAMVGAVVDTMTNRLATGRYGKTIQDVANQRRAFSKITGPSRLSPYGSVQRAPQAAASTQATVQTHLAERAQGKPSQIGGSLDYANPYHSDRSNLEGWVNPMRAAGAVGLGVGKSVHYHGLAPHNIGRAAPDYSVEVPADVGRLAIGPQSPNLFGVPANLANTQPRNVPAPTPAPRGPLDPDARIAQAFDTTAQPRTPTPQFASLPASVMDRMSAPAMPQGTPPASMMNRAPQGSLLSSFANGAANAAGGLLSAVTGLGTANAAIPPNAAASVAPLSAPTPKGRRVGPPAPDQRVATAYDVALNTRWDPGPLPSPVRTVAPTRVVSNEYNLPAVPTPALRPTIPSLSTPRTIGPGPSIAAPSFSAPAPAARPSLASPSVAGPRSTGLGAPSVPAAPRQPNALERGLNRIGNNLPSVEQVVGGVLGSAAAGPIGLAGGAYLGREIDRRNTLASRGYDPTASMSGMAQNAMDAGWGGFGPVVADPTAMMAAERTQRRNSTLKNAAIGAVLGGAVGGPVGLLGGGILGGALGPQPGRMGALGDGVNTGLLTGGPIPAAVRNNPNLARGGSFTGLGLPDTPRAPSQSQAAKNRDRRGGRGDSGPAMSKSASDSIGKAGAGRGGLW